MLLVKFKDSLKSIKNNLAYSSENSFLTLSRIISISEYFMPFTNTGINL